MCSQFITERAPEIKQVESHITWIDNTLSELGKDKPDFNELDYVHLVLKTLNNEYFENDDDGVQSKKGYHGSDMYDFEEDYNEESPKYANSFAKLINKCAKIVYLGEKLDCVPSQLKELREIVANLNGDHKRLEGAFEYSVEALEWSLIRFNCAKSDCNVNDVHVLQEKWKALQEDSKNLAAVAYLKTYLLADFKLHETDLFHCNFLPEIIELDPTYHIWYHNMYASMRKFRKVLAFRKREEGIMEAPFEKEMECCHRQLELAPHLLLSNVDMALLQKDILWMTVYKRQRNLANRVMDIEVDVDTVYQKCMQYFDIALQLAAKKDMRKWILKIKYEKAETMIQVKDSEGIRKEGLSMLLELLEVFPNDAILHHKIGRLFLYGICHDNIILLRNADLAKQHFEKAFLLKGYDFFPCIRDYVKSFRFLAYPLPVQELWTTLQKCEDVFEKRWCDEPLYNVRIWKAFVLWIYNPEDMPDYKRKAAEWWLEAFGEYEDEKLHQGNIFRHIRQPPFGVYKQVNGQMKRMHAEICLKELKNELSLIMNDNINEKDSYKDAELFLKEIEKIQQASSHFQRDSFMRQRTRRTAYQTTKFPEYQPGLGRGQTKTTDADNDNNWRKK